MAVSINQLGFTIVALAALLLFSSAIASSESAFIVAHKKATLTKLRNGVERVSVSIDLYNRGSVTVYDVSLVDDSWPSDSFEIVSGNTSMSWESLDGGSSVSHSLVLEPKVKGVFQGAPAVITFHVPTKAAPLVAYSTPIFPLNMLEDAAPKNNLELFSYSSNFSVQRLAAQFGPPFSAISLVALFGYIISTPPKSSASKANKKRR
ncbi:hypothetical protein Cgig2_005554 [Carnegiea gigantea]|uniref:Translocon-associated protein subunit beta n=1 Tax=Carnegiea gigantea TaxID=171969 RepID=A0A9Q1QPA4_9CARY|nr:hypothetical protein Cgig2_005554 [Carnegiea gigantea]